MDVDDLLDFKKSVYDLLCQLGNRSDKKILKRLGTLKDYADNWGNHYALLKPKTPEEKQREKEWQAQPSLPLLHHCAGFFSSSPTPVRGALARSAACRWPGRFPA